MEVKNKVKRFKIGRRTERGSRTGSSACIPKIESPWKLNRWAHWPVHLGTKVYQSHWTIENHSGRKTGRHTNKILQKTVKRRLQGWLEPGKAIVGETGERSIQITLVNFVSDKSFLPYALRESWLSSPAVLMMHSDDKYSQSGSIVAFSVTTFRGTSRVHSSFG